MYLNSQQLTLAITLPAYAEELFRLTDHNRSFLGQWLPWLDSIRHPGDTLAFICEQERRRLLGEGLHCTIFFQGRIAGVVAFNSVDAVSSTAILGYWLGKEFAGRGIMTLAAGEMLAAGWAELGIRRVELTCDRNNFKSRRLAVRLGFQEIRQPGGVEVRDRLLYCLAGPSCQTLPADG